MEMEIGVTWQKFIMTGMIALMCLQRYFTDIGETVFITETEAEAKLKEMEENHGR